MCIWYLHCVAPIGDTNTIHGGGGGGGGCEAAAEKFKRPYDCRVRRPSRVRVMLRLVTIVIVDYKKRPKTIDDLAIDSSKVFKLNQIINILKQYNNEFVPSGASVV